MAKYRVRQTVEKPGPEFIYCEANSPEEAYEQFLRSGWVGGYGHLKVSIDMRWRYPYPPSHPRSCHFYPTPGVPEPCANSP